MTEPAPYTEQDERLVAEALRARGGMTWSTAIQDAHNVLAALAGAGRLLPEDARTEWAIELFPAEENGGKPYIVQTETGSEEHARSVAGTGPGKLIRRQVGPWVPVPKPEPDMSTAPNPSVGAHFEAHSAHIPDVPEEEQA